MTNRTTFSHRLVLKDKRASHFFMTLEAPFVFAEQQLSSCSFHVFSVHIVTGGAEHSSFRYGVMVLEHEFTFDVKMTAKACRFSIRPDDFTLITPAFDMKTSWAVAGLASLCLAGFRILIFYIDRYTCMVAEFEILVLCFMALGTGFPPDIRGAWNRRRRHNYRLMFENAARTNKDTQTYTQ
jgi:hypothetical protein